MKSAKACALVVSSAAFGLGLALLMLALAASTQAGPLDPEIPVPSVFSDDIKLTLTTDTDWEDYGPFARWWREGDREIWSFSPFFSMVTQTNVEAVQWECLYPVMSYNRYGNESRYQFFQIFAISGGGYLKGTNRVAEPFDRFTLFPFYFQQRSKDPTENYTAVFPFYGDLKKRILRDEIHFVMFPFYSQTVKKGVVTDNYFYPFFHKRHGSGKVMASGWQLWPFYGEDYRGGYTSTNSLGMTEVVGASQQQFLLWPFLFEEYRELGTDNPEHNYGVVPLFAHFRSINRDSSTYLWPFFTFTDDRARRYQEFNAIYVVVVARGPGKTETRILPFFSRAFNATQESDSYLWPLYTYKRSHNENVERERTRIFYFLYSDTIQKAKLMEHPVRRTDLAPLFTAQIQKDGSEHFQMLAPLEPFFPGNESIEREYAPLWSIYKTSKNRKKEQTSQSFLFNFYHDEITPQKKKWSIFFGMVKYESDTNGVKWTTFWNSDKKNAKSTSAQAVEKSKAVKPAGKNGK